MKLVILEKSIPEANTTIKDASNVVIKPTLLIPAYVPKQATNRGF